MGSHNKEAEQGGGKRMEEELDYTRLGISRPKIWNKPKAKTYELNRVSFGAYYQPMLENIRQKVYMESLGLDLEMRNKVEMYTLLSRTSVQLPTAGEVANMSSADLNEGPLRLASFLNDFKTKQIKEKYKNSPCEVRHEQEL